MESIRQKQIAEVIRRQFSAVLTAEGKYIYGSGLVTITEVKMSPDLNLAKMYLSNFNTENKQEVIQMMEEHYSRLKQSLHQRIKKQMRVMPELRFYLDDTLDEVYKFEGKLKLKYPSNNFIKDKIRQQLQLLRDKGIIEFVGRGNYKKVNYGNI